MTSSPASVVVRMYRDLLGDCFLIRLSGSNGEASHILIDCGLLQGVDKAKERLTAIADDIRKTTGGNVDLLVITHEHWDHMGAFSLAKDILLDPDRIKYRNVWMAWTENPDDEQAGELRQRLADRKTAMAKVSMALDKSDTCEELNELTQDLAKFIGPMETFSSGLGVAPEGRLTGGRVMEEIKKAAQTQPPQFLEPGNVVDTPGDVSMLAAVFGPPRSLARLKKDLPTEGAEKETYFGEEFLEFSLLGADAGGDGDAQIELKSPFSKRYSIPFDDHKPNADSRWGKKGSATPERWLFDHYFASIDDTNRAQSYRRIDGDWTLAASSLALKLDSDTNNTSLVLAFKLPDDTFMLFAADAQVGNWLSWHDQTYRIEDKDLTASDILGRTRLYKVGHHGSHNATLKTKGLELMVRPDLTSMISTIEDVAKDQGTKGWLMPDPDVKSALLEHCNGRVIRGDKLWSGDEDTAPYRAQPSFGLDESSPLFVELTVYPPPNTSKTKEGRNGKPVQPRQRSATGRKNRPSTVSRPGR